MKKQRFMIGAVLFWCILAVSGAAWCGDNGNGTVTVNGLVWLKDAGCLGEMDWRDAMARPKSLAHGQCGLTDNSRPGDWRLPDLNELRDVYSSKSQFERVRKFPYWSSSTHYTGSRISTLAWAVFMNSGYMYGKSMGTPLCVWPVRGGRPGMAQ
ncbi:MAG: DUF1566 domain-containing protein [Geobacter sp.]|nr:DUF1566 domain-containing protein [Geobacter sp.]